MSGIESRDFSSPDETRTPDKTKIELVNIAGGQIGRFTFQPGWRWSECIKPVAKTDRCQVDHVGYCISGGLRITHEDGTEQDITAGDAYVIEPGHDAWVTSSDAFVGLEFDSSTAATFAKKN